MTEEKPVYKTLDQMIAEDEAKKNAQEQQAAQKAAGHPSVPDQVLAMQSDGGGDGISLISMPTALQHSHMLSNNHTTHDQQVYYHNYQQQQQYQQWQQQQQQQQQQHPYQLSGQSSFDQQMQQQQQQQQQQPTGESSEAVEVKLKGGRTTDDGTITSPLRPPRDPKQPSNMPELQVFTTNTPEAAGSENKKGHTRHPSNHFLDDGDAAPMAPPNRSLRSLMEQQQQGAAGTAASPTTTTTNMLGDQPDPMDLEPYFPPPQQPQGGYGGAGAPRPYAHTTFIRDPINFADNDPQLGPVDDLRIPLGLSSAPSSPLEADQNQSPQNQGMGLNYRPANSGSQQPPTMRKYIIIVIAVLAIAAIAFAIVILVQGGEDDGDASNNRDNQGIDFVPPERTPFPTATPPSSPPSPSPTEVIVYDPPSQEDCDAVLAGRAVPGQVNMIERFYELPFDIVIKEGTELIGFLNQFMEGIKTNVIPALTQCDDLQRRELRGQRQLEDISNVIANAIATGEYSDEPCSRAAENAFCQQIVVKFGVYLKGDERNVDIALMIRNAVAGTGGDATLLSRFDLDGKADSVQATEVVNLNPTESPSSSPTNNPSVQPSSSPSNNPTPSPSVSPSVSPTTSMPSGTPSVSPTMMPSSAPSCSETASWFDTEITSTPFRTGDLVTYSLSCTDVTDGIAVLIWDGLDKCSTQCIGYLDQADSDGSCASSNTGSFVVSFNLPAGQDVSTSTFLVGTMDPITAGSFSLLCPGSILASESPSSAPSVGPTELPSIEPSFVPSAAPSIEPSFAPSMIPSMRPSAVPSIAPSRLPTNSPSETPSMNPSKSPSSAPSRLPTSGPTFGPTHSPTTSPSKQPSSNPSAGPTLKGSVSPTSKPSGAPSSNPSSRPSITSSVGPTKEPSVAPSSSPSKNPTSGPTDAPSKNPTSGPTRVPSKNPTSGPTDAPSKNPTSGPTQSPSKIPTGAPITNAPTNSPTSSPTSGPTKIPSVVPSASPSMSNRPTVLATP